MDSQDEKIRALAYELWQRDGSQHGRAEDYWHQAERQLAERSDIDASAEEATIRRPPLVAGLAGH